MSPEYEKGENLDLLLNLSYVSIGTVWYGTVRYVCVEVHGNMGIISWQQKIFLLPKWISYLTVVTNETMINGQRQKQRQKKKRKVAVTDGRLPLVAAMLHVVKLPTASAAQHYCPHGYVCCVHVMYCILFVVCPSLAGNMISSSYTQEKRIDGCSR